MQRREKFISFLLLVSLLLTNFGVGRAAEPAIFYAAPTTLIDPPAIDLRLEPGQSATRDIRVVTGEVAIPRLDVLFMFDVSGSMSGVIDEAKDKGVEIMNEVRAKVPDSHFGVASFIDYPKSYDYAGYAAQYGAEGDYPWSLDQDITSDINKVQKAIKKLPLLNGQDSPEAYSRALYEAISVGWRSGAKKVIVLFGDAPAHDTDFYSQNYGVDPGKDKKAGTGDDLDFQSVVKQLANHNIEVITINAGATSGDVQEGFSYIAVETNGQAFDIGSSGKAAKAVIRGLEESVSSINRLTATLSRGAPAWASVRPPEFTDIEGGATRTFELVVNAPDMDMSATYNFEVQIAADDALLGSVSVTVIITAPEATEPPDDRGGVDDKLAKALLQDKRKLIEELTNLSVTWLGIEVTEPTLLEKRNAFNESEAQILVDQYESNGFPNDEARERFSRLVLTEQVLKDLYHQAVVSGDVGSEALAKILWMDLNLEHLIPGAKLFGQALPDDVIGDFITRLSGAVKKFFQLVVKFLPIQETYKSVINSFLDLAFTLFGGKGALKEAFIQTVRLYYDFNLAAPIILRMQPALDDAVQAANGDGILSSSYSHASERVKQEVNARKEESGKAIGGAKTKIAASDISNFVHSVASVASAITPPGPWTIAAKAAEVITFIISNVSLAWAIGDTFRDMNQTTNLGVQMGDIAFDPSRPVSGLDAGFHLPPADQFASIQNAPARAIQPATIEYFESLEARLQVDRATFESELRKIQEMARNGQSRAIYDDLDEFARSSRQIFTSFEAGVTPIFIVAERADAEVTGFRPAFEKLFVNSQMHSADVLNLYAAIFKYIENPSDSAAQQEVISQTDKVLAGLTEYEVSIESTSQLIQTLPLPAMAVINGHIATGAVSTGNIVQVTLILQNNGAAAANEVRIELQPIVGVQIRPPSSISIDNLASGEQRSINANILIESGDNKPTLNAHVYTDENPTAIYTVVLQRTEGGIIPPPPPPTPDHNDEGSGGGGLGIAFVLIALSIGGVWIYVTSQIRRPLSTGGFKQLTRPGSSGQAALRILYGSSAGQTIPLSQPSLLIGRSRLCNIVLADLTVSRQHARLQFMNGYWYLQDQNSKTGVYVNGQRISAVALRSGDQIRIGETIFEFRLT